MAIISEGRKCIVFNQADIHQQCTASYWMLFTLKTRRGEENRKVSFYKLPLKFYACVFHSTHVFMTSLKKESINIIYKVYCFAISHVIHES